jgi:MFS transporter, ACDE family, multidrug resistance protein
MSERGEASADPGADLGAGGTGSSGARAERRGLISILSRRGVGGILLVVLVVMLGLGMVFPIVPLYARSFGVSLASVGAFIAGFGIMRLLFDLAGGIVVDRLGERAVTVGGLVVMGAASFGTAVTGTFGSAATMWALGGAGSAVVFAGLYSYLLKVVPKDEMARTLGIFYGTFNVGIIAGGPLGGLIAHSFGLRGPFIAYAALLGLAAFLYARVVETPPGSGRSAAVGPQSLPRSSLSALKALVGNRGFVAACAGNLAYLWMVAAVFETLVPLLAREQLGMSTSGIGVLFAVATAAELAVLYPAGTFADRVGRRAVLMPSLAGLAVMTAVTGWSPGPAALAVSLGVLGLVSGIAGVPPAAILSDVSPERSAGMAVGVFRFCGDLGFVLGPALAGAAAAALGFRAAFAISAVPTAVAFMVIVWAPETLALRATPGTDPASAPRASGALDP